MSQNLDTESGVDIRVTGCAVNMAYKDMSVRVKTLMLAQAGAECSLRLQACTTCIQRGIMEFSCEGRTL